VHDLVSHAPDLVITRYPWNRFRAVVPDLVQCFGNPFDIPFNRIPVPAG